MVPAFDRRRRGHARGNFARLSSFARLHSSIFRRRKIILRSRKGRHARGCRRLLNQMSCRAESRHLWTFLAAFKIRDVIRSLPVRSTFSLPVYVAASPARSILDFGRNDKEHNANGYACSIICRRKRSSADWEVNCLNVSRSVGKKNFFAVVFASAEANAT